MEHLIFFPLIGLRVLSHGFRYNTFTTPSQTPFFVSSLPMVRDFTDGTTDTPHPISSNVSRLCVCGFESPTHTFCHSKMPSEVIIKYVLNKNKVNIKATLVHVTRFDQGQTSSHGAPVEASVSGSIRNITHRWEASFRVYMTIYCKQIISGTWPWHTPKYNQTKFDIPAYRQAVVVTEIRAFIMSTYCAAKWQIPRNKGKQDLLPAESDGIGTPHSQSHTIIIHTV